MRALLRSALPDGTAVRAGADFLDREVSWARALRVHGGFGNLEPRALALISLETLRLMPTRPSPAQAIQALGARDVAAVALRGELESYQRPLTERLAERIGCVLLQLPGGKDGQVGVVEEAVNAYLAGSGRPPDWAPSAPGKAGEPE